VKIEPATVEEIRTAPNFDELAAEYALESRLEEMPWPRVDWETYRRLEDAGALHVFSARTDDAVLVGFVVMIISMVPEYGVRLACTEAFFVAKAHRHSAAGLKLLAVVEARARELKAPGIVVSAPFGGKLAEVLPRCRFREVGRTFFKVFAYA
jgi:GNAT superfamily N-acetyltransferase